MILKIALKTPDALRDAVEAMVEHDLDNQEELDESRDTLVDKYTKKAEKWFRYGEIVTLEIDFDKDTCIVVKN